MGKLIAIVIGVFLAIYLLLRPVVHTAATHLTATILILGVGFPLLIAAVVLFIRGMTHHTVISLNPLPPAPPRPQLPAPAEVQMIEAPVRRPDPWTADGPTWAALVEQAEREELLRSGPREARIVRFGGCEGPGCTEALDDRPWSIEVEGDGGQVESHSFCSRECTERWQQKDRAERAGRSGGR